MTPETSTPVDSSGDGDATGDLAAVVLAAGLGTRLRPLTAHRPKPLCPVGNVALVDAAVERVAAITRAVAVNLHAGRWLMEAHLSAEPWLQLSVEEPQVLGTAGALGQLRWWIDGRPVLVVNGDTWATAALDAFVATWDRERVAVLVHQDEGSTDRPRFTPTSRLVATLLPWHETSRLEATPSGLYRCCLEPAAAASRLQVVGAGGAFFDCGTPGSYLAANLAAAAGGSLVASGATVTGSVDRSVIGDAIVGGSVEQTVVWSGAEVVEGEVLVRAIRTDRGTTVLVR